MKHPEDLIYTAKTFINELEKVQETYFVNLVNNLKLNINGEQWLFDYIYNTSDEDKYDDFSHYLEHYTQSYDNMMQENGDISSIEPDLETSFPAFYDDKEQICAELDTLFVMSFSLGID